MKKITEIFKKLSLLILIGLLFAQCQEKAENKFITIQNGQFILNASPYYFMGTNFWYGPILGSTGQGGDRERLAKELDLLKETGITNLRVLVGADGYPGQEVKISPTLQMEPGVYNDTLLDGLDYFMHEVAKRNMHAVLYLNNSWEWSGGYGQYLNWAGMGDIPMEGVHDWPKFVQYVAQYAHCEPCHELFFNHVKFILSRTNSYSGVKYTDDPAIMAWQVGNEPRAFSEEAKKPFADWLAKATSLIRSLDKNHLISIGNEGLMGCEEDMGLFEQIHSDPNVDYITIHIWPFNWSWIKNRDIPASMPEVIEKANQYIDSHLEVAKKQQKPVTIEEFGFPRDGYTFSHDSTVQYRDQFYDVIFSRVLNDAKNNGLIAGSNFWAWAGYGRASHLNWKPGADYLGDPAQEEQGLNAVFNTDSTVELIKKYSNQLTNRD